MSQDHDLTGSYYRAPELPPAFDNVIRIDLTTTAFQVNSDSLVTRIPIAPKGYLVTDFDLYRLSSVKIDSGRLSFTTEPSIGVSYQFTGRALEGDYPMKGYSQYYVGNTIMIEGRIIRMLFGFKITESEVRFTKGLGC